MTNITVCGAMGRMGKSIIGVVDRDPKTRLVGAIEANRHPMIGSVIGRSVKVTDDLKSVIVKTGVIIDFSSPEATLKNLAVAVKHKKPYIIGATGFSEAELKTIKKAAAVIPVAISPTGA